MKNVEKSELQKTSTNSDLHCFKTQNVINSQYIRRNQLFRELYRQKKPFDGNFNYIYNQKKSVNNTLINQKFARQYQKETVIKFLRRHYISKRIQELTQD
ncbi:MAG: hypothetical protein GF364_05155 [Candidatus Lokiarchaeota archaeon]|nr:hypothetical protein [Candidatus Lokiarchaeota archaeon]